jgi:hypothetical protein
MADRFHDAEDVVGHSNIVDQSYDAEDDMDLTEGPEFDALKDGYGDGYGDGYSDDYGNDYGDSYNDDCDDGDENEDEEALPFKSPFIRYPVHHDIPP